MSACSSPPRGLAVLTEGARARVCVLQEAQLFTDLLGDHGKPVWPLWELMKWLVGMSSHTLPAIGKSGRSPGTCGAVVGWASG